MTTQEEFLGGGGLALSFEDVEDCYTLIVTEEPKIEQTVDYDTNEPEFWPNGDPKLRWIVYGVLEPDPEVPHTFEGEDYELEDEDDDGERRLFIQSFALSAWRKTLAALPKNQKRIDPGDRVFVECTELKDNGRKRKPTKVLAFEVTKNARPDLVPVAEEEPEVDDAPEQETPARGRRSRAAAKEEAAPATRSRRGRAAAKVEEPEEDEEPAPTTTRRRAGGRTAAASRTAPASRGRGTRSRSSRAAADDEEPAQAASTARGRARARTAAAAAARSAARSAAGQDDDEAPF